MKIWIATLLALVLCLNLTCALAESRNDDEWYPFVIPAKLDPNSPANIGKLVLDVPAGKHGFCKVKGTEFVFEDGTPIRFWGTNLCFSACFPTHKQAKIIADRLAFFGFNAVRFHHMDFFFEPKGIFEDVCPAYKNPQMKETGHLSPQQMDKLDYLIYCLKERGIYVNMNLLVSRHFTEADGVKDAANLGMAAKPVSMFDPTLIELQKKYARDLLTHYNPYTKLEYNNDPAIALVEITNENSIIESWKNDRLNTHHANSTDSIPDYYITTLDLAWNDWLKNRYKTLENIKKIRSFKELNPSKLIVKEGTNWELKKHNNANAEKEIKNNKIILNVKNITGTNWHVQYIANNINLLKNKKYIFKFSGHSNKKLHIVLITQQLDSPYKNLGLARGIDLDLQETSYQIPFIVNENCSNAKIGFVIGGAKGKIYLKNISIEEIETLQFIPEEKSLTEFKFHRPIYSLLMLYPDSSKNDIKNFYIELEKKYLDKMKAYLQNDLKIKIPITGIGGYWNREDIKTQASSDFIDTHAYWDHPDFPNKLWDRNNFTIKNKSVLLDDDLGFIGAIIKRKPNNNKPFTVTEWSHCYPNIYDYEAPVLLASEAVKNNFAGLFHFALKHFILKNSFPIDYIDSYFDTNSNSQQLILSALGSLLYQKSKYLESNLKKGVLKIDSDILKGVEGFIKSGTFEFTDFTIKAFENGAIFFYSSKGKSIKESDNLILITLSGIKNKNSYWDKNGKFNWGTPPVLLKKIDAEINLFSSRKFKVYELNPQGKRNKEVKTIFKNNVLSFSNKESYTPWFELEAQ